MKKISKIITKTSVTVNFDGKTFTFGVNTPEYNEIITCLKEGRQDDLIALVDRAQRLVDKGNETTKANFIFKNGNLFVNDIQVHGLLAEHMIHYMNNGLALAPLIRFFEKVLKNPSERARNDLYSFLVANDHPITESGNFIAYKRVLSADSTGAMLDIHSRTMDNRPGSRLTMDRSKVDSNPNVTCSYGLHVANWNYANNKYGSQENPVLEVEVNPADVVAIPTDYDQSKIRVCEYFVRCIVQNPEKTKIVPSAVDQPEETPEKSEMADDESDDAHACHDCDCYHNTEVDDLDEGEDFGDEDFEDEEEEEFTPFEVCLKELRGIVWSKSSTDTLIRLNKRIAATRRSKKNFVYRGVEYTSDELDRLQEELKKLLKARARNRKTK